ncbi:NADP-dependent oxidoreductase [Okibacterium endophyticum]
MKSAQFRRFGDPSVIEIADADVPRPDAGEMLIRVAAMSVNSVDAAHRSGKLGFIAGTRLPQGLGIDAVGTVEKVGAQVDGFAIGERVWAIRSGLAGLRSPTGLASEFAVVDARRVAHAPESLDDIEAAAFVVTGYTALRALRDSLRLRPGDRVVIRGASGGVGSAAVQIAAAMKGRVAGIASEQKSDLVLSLGAVEVFDYASATPSSVGSADAVFDTVGTQLAEWRRIVRRDGRMVTVAVQSPAALATIGLTSVHGSRRIRAFAGEPPAGQLAALTEFVEAHQVRPVVHQTFRLDDIQKAHEVFASRGIAGKLVITV